MRRGKKRPLLRWEIETNPLYKMGLQEGLDFAVKWLKCWLEHHPRIQKEAIGMYVKKVNRSIGKKL